MTCDLPVHGGLGEAGLIAFIVSVTPIAIHVDDNVASKFLAKLEGELADKHHRQRIVAVDVEDWCLDHLRYVGGVHRRARVLRQRGKSDLIVHHDVNGPASAITFQLRHVQGLCHDSLSGESGIAMDQERQHFFATLGVAANPLAGARGPFHHRIDMFEVAGVG